MMIEQYLLYFSFVLRIILTEDLWFFFIDKWQQLSCESICIQLRSDKIRCYYDRIQLNTNHNDIVFQCNPYRRFTIVFRPYVIRPGINWTILEANVRVVIKHRITAFLVKKYVTSGNSLFHHAHHLQYPNLESSVDSNS